MGNHEAMMRLALDAATPHADAIDALQTWIVNGGDNTLAEFVRFSATPADLDDLLSDARESLPPRVADWLASLKSHWRSGGLLFVHAGVNPGVELESFLAEPWNAPLATLGGDRHWAWVRRPFLSAAPGPQGFSGYFVVHGHTPNDLRPDPSPADQIRRFRLNLDSGSVMTGVADDGDLPRRERRGRDRARAVRLGDGRVSGAGRIANARSSAIIARRGRGRGLVRLCEPGSRTRWRSWPRRPSAESSSKTAASPRRWRAAPSRERRSTPSSTPPAMSCCPGWSTPTIISTRR